jgi:hypothetical protein
MCRAADTELPELVWKRTRWEAHDDRLMAALARHQPTVDGADSCKRA